MIPELRKKYNSEFTQKRYDGFIDVLNSVYGYKIEFRIAETPIFLPLNFKNTLLTASGEIVNFLKSDAFKEISKSAIPSGSEVLDENEFPEMLALDFAVCRDESGQLIPQLIELQGFPSLYCYQEFLNMKFREHFDIAPQYTNFFNGLDHNSYINMLKEIIIGESDPENVVLLEIEPEKQKTRIDFSCAETWLGVKAVCITDIIKDSRKLYYIKNGKRIQIERIYNRVIFDELKKRFDLKLSFSFQDKLEVKWIPHPNWFFKISKHTLPFLKSKYVPQTYFLHQLEKYPDDLENYVLKPLYSFAGAGVIYDVTIEILDSIKEKHNYILQKKINYEPVIETLDVPAKAELRLLFLWKDKPMLVNNLVRLSKGKMMGVDFNKDKTWVGSSIGYYIKN
ncbi:MAG: hypothetical protein ACRDFC_06230 [Ignavibacteria bacterium]